MKTLFVLMLVLAIIGMGCWAIPVATKGYEDHEAAESAPAGSPPSPPPLEGEDSTVKLVYMAGVLAAVLFGERGLLWLYRRKPGGSK